MAKGLRKKKLSLIPFSIYEISYSEPKKDSGLGNLTGIHATVLLSQASSDVLIGGVLLFCAEFILHHTENQYQDQSIYALCQWLNQSVSNGASAKLIPLVFVMKWAYASGLDWGALEQEVNQFTANNPQKIFESELDWEALETSRDKRKVTLEYMLDLLQKANISQKKEYQSLEVLKTLWS